VVHRLLRTSPILLRDLRAQGDAAKMRL
jgi:hypothetical protein